MPRGITGVKVEGSAGIDKPQASLPPPFHTTSRAFTHHITFRLFLVPIDLTALQLHPTNAKMRDQQLRTARLIRSIKSRYRTQAYLILAHHFFLSSPMLLDIFIIFFILVSNFMNRQHAFPYHLVTQGLNLLVDQRRMLLL